MAIVTISRGSASGGLLLATGIADTLGYKILSREDIVHKAAQIVGVSEEKLSEALLKPPGFWDKLKHERRRYLAYVQAALCEHAQEDRIVYHGNAGHLLLPGISHVVCIRLIAPLPLRVSMFMEREKVGRDEAIQSIEKVDHQRQTWTRFLYGEDWLNPNLYDLILNLKTLTVQGAVEVACSIILRKEFARTEDSQKALANLVLASRVRAALAADEETASAEVSVAAEEGVIHLKGRLRTASLVDAVIKVAGHVKGVQQVERDQLDAPDYTL